MKNDTTTPLDLPPAHRGEPVDDAPEVQEQGEPRTRNFGETRVARHAPDFGPEQDAFTLLPTPPLFEDTRSAERWIKDNGDDGATYLVVRLVARHKVSVVVETRRSLVAVP